MPIDINGLKPYQLKISEDARDTEDVLVFGGNIETFRRSQVQELAATALNETLGDRDRRAALEKLERWAQQGSKFAQSALLEMGIGVRGTMTDKQFKSTVAKLNLDDKTRRKLEAMGPKFMAYVSDLISENSPDARMQLRDLADRVGGDAAQQLVAEFNSAEAEEVALAFMRGCPDYESGNNNIITLVDHLGNMYLGRNTSAAEDQENPEEEVIQELLVRGFWTVPHLTAAFHDLNKAGLMQQPRGKAKPLTQDEQQSLSLSCSALANMQLGSPEYANHLENVLTAYLRFALPDERVRSWRSLIGTSEYFDVMTQAVFFVWQNYRADYEPSEGAEEYIKQYLAGRMATLPLLNAAWDKCVKETGGRGLITEAEAIVDEERSLADASLADIDSRITVRR